MSNNPNGIPITIQGLTMGSASGNSGQGPTVLTQSQANQLLQRIRQAGAASGGGPIKIQAIQTNPNTGAKQIVAIPIHSSGQNNTQTITVSPATTTMSMGNSRMVMGNSPMKVIKIPASGFTGTGMSGVQFGDSSGMPPGVKVVKLSATTSGIANARTVYSPQVVTNVTPSKAAMAPIIHNSMSEPSSESRKRSDIDFDAFTDVKRRKTEKGGKGLRHFSMKVCEKVQAKGSTSYNEVADELVNELTDPRCTSPTDQQYDQKNIRRRVYDALNVLMAMNIISKEKKEIRWLGLPTSSIQEANGLELDKAKRIDRIKAKTQQLQDLILQQIAFKNLVERNKEREKREGPPAPNSAIQLPFIIVNTSKKTVIDCSISNDKMEYLFNFDDTFEIHDDMDVLKRMGLSLGLELGQVSVENLAKARTMVPRALEQYVVQLAEKGPGTGNMPKVSPPKILKEEFLEAASSMEPQSDRDTDSEVDIN